jgi:tetratricopeptide (TPR) repeat protein
LERGDYRNAEDAFGRFLASPLSQRLPLRAAAEVLADMGLLYQCVKRYSKAEKMYRGAASLYERLSDEGCLAVATSSLAYLLFETGRYGDAEPQYRKCIALHERSRNTRELGIALEGLADVLARLGRVDEAESYYMASVSIARSCGAVSEASGILQKIRLLQ